MKNPTTDKEFTVDEVALHMRKVLGTLSEFHPTTTLAGRMVKAVIDQYDDLSGAETPKKGPLGQEETSHG